MQLPAILNLNHGVKSSMPTPLRLAACLIATLCTVCAFAQTSSNQAGATSQSTAAPTAYAYVLTKLANNDTELDGYSVDSRGSIIRWCGRSQLL